ncbi:Transmembrane protein 65 [Schistosoma japonicum]|nr:Transmembrane protein 65 [Schistosoma japonicum]
MFWCRSAVCLGRGVLTYANRSLFLQCSPLCGSFNRQSNNSWINKIVKRLSPRDKLILYQELSKNINDKFDPSNYPPETQETPLTYAQLKTWLVGYVEKFIEKIGISVPPLTASQLACSSVRWSVATGRIVGITIGCLLGLLPLICFNR